MRKEFVKTSCSLTPNNRSYKYSYLLRPIASPKSKIYDITCKPRLRNISKNLPDCASPKFSQLPKKTQHNLQLNNFSKIWREKSSNKFLEDQVFRAKVNELRKFNILNICEDELASVSSVYNSPENRTNLNHGRKAESVTGVIKNWSEITSKCRIDLRGRPARFLPAMHMNKFNEKNKSYSFFNPALKEDLQIIVDHSSHNSKKHFKEEQIYLSYLDTRERKSSRVMS